MKRSTKTLVIAALLGFAILAWQAETATAQTYFSISTPRFSFAIGNNYPISPYNPYYYSGPVYHPPSVHYHAIRVPGPLHFSPRHGLHRHGRTVIVPHYVPGHFDYRQGPYIVPNPFFHSHHH